jgi:hypothetical protein
MDDTHGITPQDKTDAPERKPSGELGGHPVNADETAPREHVPEPGGSQTSGPDAGGGGNRQPDAVDDEPGSDL